jgi:hypothetical protein
MYQNVGKIVVSNFFKGDTFKHAKNVTFIQKISIILILKQVKHEGLKILIIGIIIDQGWIS